MLERLSKGYWLLKVTDGHSWSIPGFCFEE